ncbi:hypothetical protein [Gloeothece verrucosa]|uniref:Uncharacterized protein n=1 Tax=Gloeothece verrucosa (strain PCC 7822) TaxID=497965 RepID=E0UCB4_GLOV7|nr:hypothetical protein [Gloeothece verrucosa]ADN12871.1 hypothetical protein Cyan7822_0851 [Gloeothece verrucosa PCC 7822]
MNELLLPWMPGFWEYYHSAPPIDWLKQVDKQGVVFVAPNPITGALDYVSCPEEYYEREAETQSWIENSMIDPNFDPFADWYPLKELDEPIIKEEEIFI